ncbi:MAG: leucyl aminopeptidase [Planctomycetaceae bacterium]|nr:leucyl aminopeptidase [Planctomycetaceae bacterium]
MKMTKEKTLLGIVAVALAGVAAMDRKYDPVKVPSTTAPSDVPPLPPEPPEAVRVPPPRGRSMFDRFDDLRAPDLLELSQPPHMEIPAATPPVRPYPHLDAARGLRHLFFDPVVPPPKEDQPPPAEDASAGSGEEEAAPAAAADAPKTVDFADYDWVKTSDQLGQMAYGRIELLAPDRDAGRSKFDLVVDASLDFTFNQIDKTGKSFGPFKFRHRTAELGFADTLKNRFGERRARQTAGRKELEPAALRENAAWLQEESLRPRYVKERRWALQEAADSYREALRRNPDDKQTLKDLGRIYRLLQDPEGEVALYDWWLEGQRISKDPEILALGGEGLEILGLLERARARYEEALVANSDPKVRLRLAALLVASGSLEDARAALDRGVAFGRVLADAAVFARDVGNTPGNEGTPTFLAGKAREIASESGMKLTVLDRADMEREGMGGILGVARGTEEPPKFIVLEHNAGRADLPLYALVGKGVTFDSGGISLKPGADMHEMKFDKCGAVAVLATMRAVGRLKLPLRVAGICPATENLPSGKAYKPGDVVRTLGGRTVEILNTDAEGRMLLVDGITWAKRMQPRCIVDLATLTGACVVALGDAASGLFSTDDRLASSLESAGAAAGERLWRMPVYEEYTEQIKSDVADFKNTGGRNAGACTAAALLKAHAEGTPWAHLDIAGTAWGGKDRDYVRKGATGVGPRTLVRWLVAESAAPGK